MSFEEILVATDFGECSQRVLADAVQLAKRLGGHLTLVHVYDVPTYAYMDGNIGGLDLLTPLEKSARKQLDDAARIVAAELPGTSAVLRRGVAWEEILDAAKSVGAGLVVVGTHGRRGVYRVLLGSVAERVVRLAPVPVLTIPCGATPGEAPP